MSSSFRTQERPVHEAVPIPPTDALPIAAAAHLLGDRWSLPIVREIRAGNGQFNEIHRALPGLSRTLLSTRLRSMVTRGLIAHPAVASGSAPYVLTAAGEALGPVLHELGRWALDHQVNMHEDDREDTRLLLWRMGRSIDHLAIPHRVTVQFHFDPSQAAGYLDLTRRGTQAHIGTYAGAPDIVVKVASSTLSDLWWRRRACDQAIAACDIRFDGPLRLVQDFRNWFRYPEDVADQLA